MIKTGEIKILLVEDSREYARLMQELLNDSILAGKFKMDNCAYLSEAIELLGKNKYDVILLDLNLPDSIEMQAVDKINALNLGIPVIIQTGYENEDASLLTFQSGVQDYLLKGEYDGNLLAKSIRYAIERHNLQKELKNYAEKLKKSQDRLLDAQELAHIGHWELNVHSKEMEWSDELYNVFETTKKEDSPKLDQLIELIHPNDQDFANEVFIHAIDQKSDFNIDLRIVIGKTERKIKYVNLRIKPLKSNNDKLIGTIQDITSRKEIEDALIKSEEKYHTLFEESKDPIYMTTKEGRFIDFNNAMMELFGHNREELRKLDVRDLYYNPIERQKFRSEIERKGYVRDFGVRLKRKDGSPIHCLVTSTIWKSNDQTKIGYQGIIRDMTEHIRNEELLRENEIAIRSAKLKEQFLANMSHEIRTPLNAIAGLTHLLKSTQFTEKQKEYLESIDISINHLLELINDILDFSKIEAGKIELESISFNLKSLVENLVSTVEIKGSEKNIPVKVAFDNSIPESLEGDTLRLNQILYNLLGNAIKFTEKGFIELTVKSLNKDSGKITVEFSVKDTGIGIPESKKQIIFDSFTQLTENPKRVIEGTGLGLAITKKLVELQGGTISVESDVGKGSVFTFQIPFKIHSSKSLTQIEVAAVSSEKGIELPENTKILIAEDKKLNQVVLVEILENKWPHVKLTVANNGKEALEYVKKEHFDLVIMDVQMPEMDGLEATRKIRRIKDSGKKDIPILALTAYATTGEAEKCIEAGMNAYISKPFKPDLLYEKITALIHQKHPETVTKIILVEESTPGFDLSYLYDLTKNNDRLRRKMLDMLLEETPDELIALNRQLKANEGMGIAKAAHKMKSAATYLGAAETKEKLEQIELIAADNPDWNILENLVKQVTVEFESYVKTLTEKLKN